MNLQSNPSCPTRRRASDILWIFVIVLAGVVVYFIQREQVMLEEARRQELVLRDSLLRADIAAVVIDAKQKILFVTPALAALAGYTEAELVQQPLDILMPAAYRDAHKRGSAEAAKNNSTRVSKQLIHCHLLKKTGQNIPITTNLVGTYGEGGMAVVTPTGNGTIHEKVQEVALDAAKVGIWWLDVKRDKMVWDERTHEMYGRTTREGWTPNFEGFYRCLHPEDRKWVEHLVSQSIERRSYFKAVFRVVRTDQQVVYVRAQGQLFTSGDTDILAGVNLQVTAAEYDGGKTQELGVQNRSLPDQ